VPLTQLDADLAAKKLPNFAFIMPNMCHSGHNCSIDQADQWVGAMVNKLQSSQALGEKSLIIITFDEASSSSVDTCCGLTSSAGGRIAAVLISPQAKPGFTDGTSISHFGMLKTILTAWGLPDLGKTAMPETLPITQPWK
jgi:phosphatidylinositol-3-phosphatase